jgi:hypothetical protein
MIWIFKDKKKFFFFLINSLKKKKKKKNAEKRCLKQTYSIKNLSNLFYLHKNLIIYDK